MPESKKPRFYLEGQHLDLRGGRLEGFRVVVRLGEDRAEIHMMLAVPRSIERGIPETVRLELRSLIDALKVAAESPSNISFGQAPHS